MELLLSIFCDIWFKGMIWGLWATLAIFLLLWIVEFGWLIARWLMDAKETWSEANMDRQVWCGDLSKILIKDMPGDDIDEEQVGWYLFAVFVYCVCFAVVILVWPFLVMVAVTYGSMRLLRGGFRLRRLVWKAVKELKNKADKGHDHDGRYVKG